MLQDNVREEMDTKENGLRELTLEEWELVAGGVDSDNPYSDGGTGWVLTGGGNTGGRYYGPPGGGLGGGFVGGGSSGIADAVSTVIGWLTGGGDPTEIANRFEPEAGQVVLKGGQEIRQLDGDIWLDFNRDGKMDARLWENPSDGDSKTDYRWNEGNDTWEPIPDSTFRDWVDNRLGDLFN